MRKLLLLSTCLLAASAGKLFAVESSTAPEPRSLTSIRTDVSEALKAEATTRRSGDNPTQVLRLVDLYLEMASHPKRDTSPLLNELGQQVRLRLNTIHDRLERRFGEKTSSSKKIAKPGSIMSKKDAHVLAQQLPPPVPPQAGAAAVGQGVAVAVPPNTTTQRTDFGPELVELIEATVSPSTWRINGGNGAVVYFAPLHALVVSAPDEVHAQISDVLIQLNAAQRRQDGTQVVADVVGVRAGQ